MPLTDQGESGAAQLLRKMPGSVGETASPNWPTALHKISGEQRLVWLEAQGFITPWCWLGRN